MNILKPLTGKQIEPLLASWFGLKDCVNLFNVERLLAFANAAIELSQKVAAEETKAAPYSVIRPIENDEELDKIIALGNHLADEVGDDEGHMLYPLFNRVMDVIKVWEDAHPIPEQKIVYRIYGVEGDRLTTDLPENIAPTAYKVILSTNELIGDDDLLRDYHALQAKGI